MGRPPGAQNKGKPFRTALQMEIAALGEDHKALRAIARNLIALAERPEKEAFPAIREIADRLDGKSAQMNGEDDETPAKTIRRIERRIVDPQSSNGEGV
jgi:hypothetical protein